MIASAEAWARCLWALMPPSSLWRTDEDGVLSRLFLALGEELARVDAKGEALIAESIPSSAVDLLTEWEDDFGLPHDGTTAERQARISAHELKRQRYRPADILAAVRPLLANPESNDPTIIERSRAFAISVGDDSEIFRFFVYRDPAEPGGYDLDEAQRIVNVIKPSHTVGYVIESISFLCDDAFSLCDRDLLGV